MLKRPFGRGRSRSGDDGEDAENRNELMRRELPHNAGDTIDPALIAAHLPHLAARPHSQEQLLQVDRTSTTEVPDSLLGWGPAQFAGNLAAYTKGTLQTTCLVGKTAGGVMQVLQSRGRCILF